MLRFCTLAAHKLYSELSDVFLWQEYMLFELGGASKRGTPPKLNGNAGSRSTEAERIASWKRVLSLLTIKHIETKACLVFFWLSSDHIRYSCFGAEFSVGNAWGQLRDYCPYFYSTVQTVPWSENTNSIS
jgi:hypothetical protein